MKLNLNFVNKVPKIAKDNEIFLLTQKVIKNREIKQLTKSIFSFIYILLSTPSFLYSSTKIVRFFTTLMNFFSEINFGKKSMFDSLIYFLARF